MLFFECYFIGLRLIVVGELFLYVVNNWKKDFIWVCEQLDDLCGLWWGYVCIVIIDVINWYFFLMMFKEVYKYYFNIFFILIIINNIYIQQVLIFGEVDFGIMFNFQIFCELQVWVFVEMNMGIVVFIGYLLVSCSVVCFSQCFDYFFILLFVLLMISELVEVLVNISGNEVKEVVVLNNIYMICILIKEQMGIGILCWLDIFDEIEFGQLVFVLLIDLQFKFFILVLCVLFVCQFFFVVLMMLNQLEMFFS